MSGGKPKYAWHYTPPTGEELTRLLKRWKISKAAAARMVDVSGRTMSRYAAGDEMIPFAFLYVLAAEHTGTLITLGGWREELGIKRK